MFTRGGGKEKRGEQLTENRLEGLLVPVHDDVHAAVVVIDGRIPLLLVLFRTRSTSPIPRRSYRGDDEVSLRCDVPHSTLTTTSCAPISRSFFLLLFLRGKPSLVVTCWRSLLTHYFLFARSPSPYSHNPHRRPTTATDDYDDGYRYTASNGTIAPDDRFAGPDKRARARTRDDTGNRMSETSETHSANKNIDAIDAFDPSPFFPH